MSGPRVRCHTCKGRSNPYRHDHKIRLASCVTCGGKGEVPVQFDRLMRKHATRMDACARCGESRLCVVVEGESLCADCVAGMFREFDTVFGDGPDADALAVPF